MLKIKIVSLFASLILLTSIIVGCSNEDEKEKEPTPEEAFAEFAQYWQTSNFEAMYDLLSEQSKAAITKDEFVERYTNIYSGIQAENLTIEIIIEEEAEGEVEREEELEPPTEVYLEYVQTLTTLAGELQFDRNVKLILEIEETETETIKTWAIDWNPAMILPHLDEGDKVRVRTLQPKRGELVDRNGEGLAINGKIYEIGIVPERLPEDATEIIEEAAKLLNMSVESVERALNQSWVQPFMFVPLKSISSTERQLIDQLMDIEGNAVTYQQVEGRVYPLGKMAAHLTGYIGAITAEELEKYSEKQYTEQSFIGKTGLERIFEDKLRGELGGVIFIEDEAGNEKLVIAEKAAVDGPTIYLTIDTELQSVIYEQLEGEVGTAVALDPITGEVLSLVNSPAYNPNDFVLGISSEKWNELNEDERKPLLNRFTQIYAPGSTIKPITAKVAIEHGWDKEEKRHIEGTSWRKDSSWGNYQVRRVTDPKHDVDLHDALVYSDNIYFAQMALELGAEKLEEGLAKFGFGEPLPFVYGMTPSKVANDHISSDILLADTGYGQGELGITPLHLALLYTPFVNEGSIMKPLLILQGEAEVWKENVIDAESSKYILDALKAVIESPQGTATSARISGLPLAGKTGTTEFKQRQDEEGKETGWFVAMNTEDPELLVLMMIENVEGRGGSGYVVPKVRNVFLR